MIEVIGDQRLAPSGDWTRLLITYVPPLEEPDAQPTIEPFHGRLLWSAFADRRTPAVPVQIAKLSLPPIAEVPVHVRDQLAATARDYGARARLGCIGIALSAQRLGQPSVGYMGVESGVTRGRPAEELETDPLVRRFVEAIVMRIIDPLPDGTASASLVITDPGKLLELPLMHACSGCAATRDAAAAALADDPDIGAVVAVVYAETEADLG